MNSPQRSSRSFFGHIKFAAYFDSPKISNFGQTILEAKVIPLWNDLCLRSRDDFCLR